MAMMKMLTILTIVFLVTVSKCRNKSSIFLQSLRNFLSSERQPEMSAICVVKMVTAIPLNKTYDDGMGINLMTAPSLKTPNRMKYACHQCGDNKPRFTVLLDDAIDKLTMNTGRSSNLYLAPHPSGDDETGYDSRNDTFLR